MSGSMPLNEQLICTVRVANLYRIRNSDDINSNIIQFGVGEWMLYEMGKKPLAIILSHCCKRCVYSIPLKYASSNSCADWKDVFLLFKTASFASCFIALILVVSCGCWPTGLGQKGICMSLCPDRVTEPGGGFPFYWVMTGAWTRGTACRWLWRERCCISREAPGIIAGA